MSTAAPSLDKNYIKELLQNILNKNHSDIQKRLVKDFPDRYNFACPICGDSQKVSQRKRGNLYFENMYYKCFNEPECSRSFTKLLSTFSIEMDMEKKLELYEYIDSNIKYHTIANEDTMVDFKRLIPLDELVEFYQRIPDRKITGLRPLTKGSAVYDYVINKRKIRGNLDCIYEGVYHITHKWKQPVVVFLNRVKDRVIGLQTRNLLDGDDRIFKIHDFSKLYDMMYPDNDMDEQERISYNKMSQIYNLFNTDLTREINVFEGFIDSLTIPNSIGLTGIDTNLRFLIEEDGVTLKFVYDNDRSGFKKANEMIRDGQYVFLWNKFIIDISKQYKGKKSQKEMILDLSEKVKDFNKLATFFKKPLDQQFNLDKYFSNDTFDLEYLLPIQEVVKNGFLLYA